MKSDWFNPKIVRIHFSLPPLFLFIIIIISFEQNQQMASLSNKSKLNWKKAKSTAAEIAFKHKHDQTLALIGQVEPRSRSRDKNSKISQSSSIQNNKALSQNVSLRIGGFSGRQSNDHIETVGLINQQHSQLPMVKGAISCSSQLDGNDDNNDNKHDQNDWILAQSNPQKVYAERQIVQSPTMRSQKTGITEQVAARNPKESMTSHVFSQDLLHQTNTGCLAFKPLGMETVIEKDERGKLMPQSNLITPIGNGPSSSHQSQNLQRLQSGVSLYTHNKKKGGLFSKQTTEQNIALQQELDFASAEDLISYRSKPQIEVAYDSKNEAIQVTEQSESAAFSSCQNIKELVDKKASIQQSSARPVFSPNLMKMSKQSKTRMGVSTSQNQFRLAKNNSMTQVKESKQNLVVTQQNSKQSFKTVGSGCEKSAVANGKKQQVVKGGGNFKKPDRSSGSSEYYQGATLHPGLQKVQNIYSKKQESNPTRQTSMSQRTDFTYALQSAVGSVKQVAGDAPPTVKFDQSAIESGGGDTNHTKSTQSQLIKDIQKEMHLLPIERSESAEEQTQPLYESKSIPLLTKNKLYLQPTGNSKEVSRKLRNMQQQNLNSLGGSQTTEIFQSQEMHQDHDVKTNMMVKAAGLMKSSTQENLLKADTVLLTENAQPDQQHKQQLLNTFQRKMKSQAAFIEDKQPLQNIKDKILNITEKPPGGVDNQESRLVTDFNMHLQNKERMKNLMALLGKQNEENLRRIGSAGEDQSISTIQQTMSQRNRKNAPPKHMQTVGESTLPQIRKKVLLEGQNSSNTLGQGLSSSSLETGDTKYGQTFLRMAKQFNSQIYTALSRPDSADSEANEQHINSYGRIAGFGNLNKKLPSSTTTNSVNVHVEDQKDTSKNQQNKSIVNKSGLFRQFAQVNNEQSNKGSMNQPGVVKHRNSRSNMFLNEIDAVDMVGPGTSPHSVEESSQPTTNTNNLSKHFNLINGDTNTYRSVGYTPAGGGGYCSKDNSPPNKSYHHKLQTRSMSQHRLLQPLAPNSNKFIHDGTSSLLNMRSQHSIQQLKMPQKSYVLVKGKAQNSEKYISTDLQPYTKMATQQLTTARGSHQRRVLMLQHMQNNNCSQGTGVPPLSNNAANHQKGSNNRKGKGAGGKFVRKRIGGHGSKGRNQQATACSIQEENQSSPEMRERDMTWWELQDENEQLKDQLLNQIAIFEQYLKVAVLQHNSRVDEQRRHLQTADMPIESQRRLKQQYSGYRNNIRTSSAGSQQCILSKERDFQFDNATKPRQQLDKNASATRDGWSQSKTATGKLQSQSVKQQMQSRVPNKGRQVKMFRWSGISRPIDGFQRNEYSAISSKILQVKCPTVHSAEQSPQRSERSSISNQKMSKVKKRSNYGSVKSISLVDNNNKDCSGRKSTGKKNHPKTRLSTSIQRSLAVKHNRQMRALGYLRPASDKEYSKWTSKIQKLWDKLNDHRNDEVIRIQNEIQKNRKDIKKLSLDNLFELDVNANDHKTLTRVQHRKANINKILKNQSDFKKVQQLEQRVRLEINRKAEFETWGFHNYIISYRIKVRMTEDIIDCAQRLQVKSDAKTERELGILKLLRDQTYEDLYNFVQKREKQPWRVWDPRHIFGYGHDFKPTFETLELSYFEICQEIDKNLQALAIIEKWYTRLRNDIPYYNSINSEMIQFCSQCFGNEGWLQLFQLRMLRKQQEAQQHDKQYMPPVDHIKRMQVDPYTLQIEERELEEEQPSTSTEKKNSSSLDSEQQQPTQEAKKRSGWDIRKPDSLLQNTLKTGYEPIMAQRKTLTDQRESAAAPASGRQSATLDGVSQEDDGPQNLNSNINSGSSQVDQTQPKDKNDIVQKIKLDAVERELEEIKKQNEQKEGKKSTWLEALAREKEEKVKREEMEKKARAARLAILFEAENMLLENETEDEEDNFYEQEALDLGAAKGTIASYMEKIDTHLQVEKRILEAWQRKDEENGGGEEECKVEETKIQDQQPQLVQE